jgi:hypothetical protein
MKKKLFFIILWEIVLIIGSVPLFRSLWMLFDRISFMNQNAGIILSFAGGIIMCIVSLFVLNSITKN